MISTEQYEYLSRFLFFQMGRVIDTNFIEQFDRQLKRYGVANKDIRIAELERQITDLQANNTKLLLENRLLKQGKDYEH